MTAYIDQTYYSNTYLGTVIASANFPALALRASAYMDQISFGRIAPIVLAATETATIDLIKMATCAVAETLQTIDQAGGVDGIQSESIGSSSVTYSAKATAQRTNSMKIVQAAAVYLAATGLLYKGFAEGEYANQHGSHYL